MVLRLHLHLSSCLHLIATVGHVLPWDFNLLFSCHWPHKQKVHLEVVNIMVQLYILSCETRDSCAINGQIVWPWIFTTLCTFPTPDQFVHRRRNWFIMALMQKIFRSLKFLLVHLVSTVTIQHANKICLHVKEEEPKIWDCRSVGCHSKLTF